MGSLAAAVRWDWFKLARRWMPWILLAVLALMSQLAVWGGFFAYQSLQHSGGTIAATAGPGRPPLGVSCKDVLAGNTAALPPQTSPQVMAGLQAQCRQEQTVLQQQLRAEYDLISLPGSIAGSLNLTLTVDLILLAILAASHIGAEYGWGTIRPNLIRGIGRWHYLAAKMLLLALVAAGSLIAVVAVTAVSSIAAARLATRPDQLAGGTTWGHAAIVLLKGWTGLLPMLAFAGFVTVLTRSTAAGMAIAIGYDLGEQVVVALLGAVFHWFATLSHYLLVQNIGSWAGLAFLGGGGTSIGAGHAALVLLAYTAALVAGALYLFEARDVAGASGGG